jgi:hypothetical protein
MSETPTVTQLSQVHSRDDMEGVDIPGALTLFDDLTAIFTGNGVTSPEEAAARFIELQGKNDGAIQLFAGNPSAATFAANFFLQNNRQLPAGMTAQTPIPNGQQFEMDGARLKTMLAPFANNLEQLSKMVANMGVGSGGEKSSAMDRATGTVRSVGLKIPLV